MTETRAHCVEQALIKGIRKHFADKRNYVPQFVARHFLYPGCWHTNRAAFGLDLFRAPLNLLWAPFYITIILMLLLMRMAGIKRASSLAKQLPGGLTTRVQQKVNALVAKELVDGEGLREAVLKEVEALSVAPESILLTVSHTQARNPWEDKLEEIIDQSLKQLMLTRTASADITNTLASTAVGALAFNKFTPGGFGLGIILATLWVKFRAEKNFFLGDTIGSWYYGVFPPKPSLLETSAGILIVMMILALVASFSGLVSDPIQAKTGMHKNRLNKMLRQLEKDAVEKANSRFKPLDPYVARILELFDTLKSQLSF